MPMCRMRSSQRQTDKSRSAYQPVCVAAHLHTIICSPDLDILAVTASFRDLFITCVGGRDHVEEVASMKIFLKGTELAATVKLVWNVDNKAVSRPRPKLCSETSPYVRFSSEVLIQSVRYKDSLSASPFSFVECLLYAKHQKRRQIMTIFAIMIGTWLST